MQNRRIMKSTFFIMLLLFFFYAFDVYTACVCVCERAFESRQRFFISLHFFFSLSIFCIIKNHDLLALSGLSVSSLFILK